MIALPYNKHKIGKTTRFGIGLIPVREESA